MTTQERDYMGQPLPPVDTRAVVAQDPTPNEISKRDSEIASLKKQLLEVTDKYRKAECAIKDTLMELGSEQSKREAAEAEAAANLKALARSKLVLQKQGDALIAEHYGPSKFKLLILARALLSTVPFLVVRSERYPVDEENFRVCCANWFDDYEREMLGVACDPVEPKAESQLVKSSQGTLFDLAEVSSAND